MIQTIKTAAWASLLASFWASLLIILVFAPEVQAQAGFPDHLRRYSDSSVVPFRIGTAVTLQGGPSLYPPNGYQPGLLSAGPQDKAYQTLVKSQFNQIEAGNETKMMSLWTGGAVRVHGHYAARTNLFDPAGPLERLCTWAGTQRPRLTVRGHCMVYYQDYTLPTFPAGQPPLFVRDAAGMRKLNTAYTPEDLRDMLRSYVQQVVDATMAQNAASRLRSGWRVVTAWDVTNEVVSEVQEAPPPLGFAYRDNDPWYSNGPSSIKGTPGYDYVSDIYRWAAQERTANVGRTITGRRITAADGFALYYNEYNLEWSAPKMAHVLALIQHVRTGGGLVDGLGFQAHVEADGLNSIQFEANINAALADKLRFSLTETDCAIKPPTPSPGPLTGAAQQANQGREYGELVALCLRHKQFCDAFQIWGATDDGSWLQNAQATPITRWVQDTRPGVTLGQSGYWPKQGQFVPQTRYDPAAGALDPQSGQTVSSAYNQILAALKAPR